MCSPLVSIITPCWNVERFIGQTIESVLSQTFANWELLIVDDGSTDRTAAIVNDYATADPRIILIRQPQNRGSALSRQSAIDRAKGRYLAFLDGDDIWLPNKLERQLAFMRETGAALTYTAFRRIDEADTIVGRLVEPPPSLNYRQLLKNTAIPTLTALVDRDLVGNVAMTVWPRDDFCLWLSILRRGLVAYGLNEDLARYRVRRHSLSSNVLRSARGVWSIYRHIEKLSLARSAWYFAHFGTRAYLKRIRF